MEEAGSKVGEHGQQGRRVAPQYLSFLQVRGVQHGEPPERRRPPHGPRLHAGLLQLDHDLPPRQRRLLPLRQRRPEGRGDTVFVPLLVRVGQQDSLRPLAGVQLPHVLRPGEVRWRACAEGAAGGRLWLVRRSRVRQAAMRQHNRERVQVGANFMAPVKEVT